MDKTHRQVLDPRMAIRYLADYMAASDQKRRSILRDCKYPRIARVVQHDDAKETAGEFIRGGCSNVTILLNRANALTQQPASDDFERDMLDHNADYLKRLAAVYQSLKLPKAEILAAKQFAPMMLNGVRVPFEPVALFRRLTSTNKVKMGAAMLRYAKGLPLKPAVADWQSAGIFALIREKLAVDGVEADLALCITIDCQAGMAYAAPTNSVTRFKNMKAACATIADVWPALKPPPGAVF